MKQLIEMLKKRQLFIVGTVIIVSVLLNGFFIKDTYFKKDIVVGNGEIIKNPQKVVKIESKVKISKIDSERPTADISTETINKLADAKGIIKKELPEDKAKRIIDEVRKMAEAEETLKALEKAVPRLKLEEIRIVQQEDDSWVIPPKVRGDLELDYLKYSVEVELNTNMLYRKTDTLPFSVGCFLYYKEQSILQTYNLMMPFKVPFTEVEVFAGAGLEAFSLSSGFRLTKNSFFHLGGMYTYDRQFAVGTGVSFDF